MPIRRLILRGIGVATMLLVVAIPTRSSAQHTNQVTMADTESNSVQNAFQPAACPPNIFSATAQVECGFVVVPENRTRPNSQMIQVAAAVVHAPAAHPQRDPIVFLDGGPSFGAIAPFALDAYFAGASFIQDRDLILVDTRGTGRSLPRLGCPEFDRADQSSFYAHPFLLSSYVADFTRAVTACHARLIAAGIDLSAYNSAESAADLDTLRRALGYRQWNLVAFSADGVLGLTYMRLYPGGIRSAIIDSGLSPQHLPGIDFLRGKNAELERMFAGCAANVACTAAYPNLRTVFFDLVHTLQAHPATITIPHFPGGSIVVRVDGAWFSVDALNEIAPESIQNLLSEIWRSAHGELHTVYQERINEPPPFDTDSFLAQGKTMSYTCHDLSSFVTDADRTQAARALEQFGPVLDDPSLWLAGDASCQIWNVGRANPAQHQPVASTIPTLVLAGEYDIVPPLIQRQIPATLPNAFFYEFPAAGHGQLASYNNDSPCARAIAAQFLATPTARPDATCIGALPLFDFTPSASGSQAQQRPSLRKRYPVVIR